MNYVLPEKCYKELDQIHDAVVLRESNLLKRKGKELKMSNNTRK